MRLIALILAVQFATGVTLIAQKVKATGILIALPQGDVLGATFAREDKVVVVQQQVFSTEDHGLTITKKRRISNWDLASRLMLSTNDLDDQTATAAAFPCGRIEASDSLGRIVLCSSGSRLELLDPKTLVRVGTAADRPGHTIRDFAIDDLRQRVWVVSSADGKLWLTLYGLKALAATESAPIPIMLTGGPLTMTLNYRTGLIAIVSNYHERRGDQADVVSCTLEKQLDCRTIAQMGAVSQASFLGDDLLLASASFADDRRQCLTSLDVRTHLASATYCSPTGVHYGVATVQDKYVVAFTGLSKREWLKEDNKSLVTSYSIWEPEIVHPNTAVVEQSEYGGLQNELRLAGSRREPYFLTYNRLMNYLHVYSISAD